MILVKRESVVKSVSEWGKGAITEKFGNGKRDGEHGVLSEHEGLKKSGWHISGHQEDEGAYGQHLNTFSATHPEHGRVWGDYDHEVHADNKKGLEHFMKHHPRDMYDPHDD